MVPFPLKKGITNGSDEGLFCREGKGNKDTHKDKGMRRRERNPLATKTQGGNSPLSPTVILALSEEFRFMSEVWCICVQNTTVHHQEWCCCYPKGKSSPLSFLQKQREKGRWRSPLSSCDEFLFLLFVADFLLKREDLLFDSLLSLKVRKKVESRCFLCDLDLPISVGVLMMMLRMNEWVMKFVRGLISLSLAPQLIMRKSAIKASHIMVWDDDDADGSGPGSQVKSFIDNQHT